MGDEEREERLFHREEAEELLPVLEPLLRGAIQHHQRMEELDREFSQVQNRILLHGGLLPPYGYLAEKRVERETLAGTLRDAVERIQETGCVVKDLEQGLLDFPSRRGDETVFLCWKLGEERIGYWHGLEEGFAGRKPLEGESNAPKPPKLQ